MTLRQHIDTAVSMGTNLKRAVVVNYKMGLESGDPEEKDIRQLTEEEKQILIDEGLLKKRKR